GAYGLVWEGGHGVLGEVLTDDGARVERPLTVIDGAPPRPGAPARMDAFYYRRDPLRDHGVEFEDLRLQGPVGGLAAWFVPADGRTGVLLLHGRRRGERREALRALPSLHAMGMPVLVLSYRNHDASDPSPDGLYHYGASEWQDALVGASALAERGVTRIVVFGISMGGAVALEAKRRWPPELPPLVALVLESPLVDPAAAVRLALGRAGVPPGGAPTQRRRLRCATASQARGRDRRAGDADGGHGRHDGADRRHRPVRRAHPRAARLPAARRRRARRGVERGTGCLRRVAARVPDRRDHRRGR